ncbi:MAG: CRTAC1 family protein [Anaerolineaceae bacterium]|nr:CRTAC1 family protein [Anaerolineaceae bacterium]
MNWKIIFLSILSSLLLFACATTPPPTDSPLAHVRFVTVTPEPTSPPSAEAAQNNLTLRDVTAEAGLTFRHGAFIESISEDPVAMMGGGLCWIDVDADGWLDLYLVNSHALQEEALWESRGGLPRNALYRNRGDGTFEDISAGSGADLALRGNGCIAGDIDQDGDIDLYVTADGPNALLLNQGNNTFVESAEAAGVAAPEWNTAAAMADVDGDGWVDLYVASYIDLNKKVPNPIGLFPQDFLGLRDHLYRNRGDGTFEDVAPAAGLTYEERGLGALFSDVDQDGDLDLYVANDGHPNRLYINRGDGTFEEDAQQMGVDDRGSGMGVSAGDYDSDGWVDLVVTNFDKEYNALYHNKATASPFGFDYATFRMGIQGFGQNQTGWGVAWLDLDLDSYLDLLTVQGQVPITDLTTDAQPIRFYRNRGDSTFLDAGRMVGSEDIGPLLARGMAPADYDNDGDLDIAIATIGGPAKLLQTNGTTGNWLTISLDHFMPGAKLTATLPDGRVLLREIHCGSSYLASDDPRLHVGVGPAEQVNVTVTLPDGKQLTRTAVPVNQMISLDTVEF